MEKDALINLTATEEALAAYAADVRELYRDNLIKSDRLATEGLLNSVETQIERDGQSYLVTMTLADYWKYVEWDTKPHWPPRDALLKWIRVKPIIPRPDDRGRIPKPEQLAFLIGRKISRVGTEGSHDLADAVTNCNRKHEELIAEALARDLGDDVHAWMLQLMDFKNGTDNRQ